MLLDSSLATPCRSVSATNSDWHEQMTCLTPQTVTCWFYSNKTTKYWVRPNTQLPLGGDISFQKRVQYEPKRFYMAAAEIILF